MLESDDSNVIAYQDEVHFQLSTTITRKWALKGSASKVKSHPGRQKASYSGYIIPSSGRLITTKPEWFNYETVIQYLRDFMRQMPDDGRRICLVVDNAPWHKKAIRLIQTVRDHRFQPKNDHRFQPVQMSSNSTNIQNAVDSIFVSLSYLRQYGSVAEVHLSDYLVLSSVRLACKVEAIGSVEKTVQYALRKN